MTNTTLGINHAEYHTHAKDPLVVLLMELYQKGTAKKTSGIPKVWLDFAKKTVPGSSIDLMLTQFGKWKIKETDIDITLRGDELYNALLNLELIKVFKYADVAHRANGNPWPNELEKAMIAYKIIPSPDAIDALRLAQASLYVNLSYVETGTLRYSVRRSIPNVPTRIPPQWFTENCKPEFSDNEIWTRWTRGLTYCFQTGDRVKGFEFRAWLKKVLTSCRPTRFDITKLASDLSGTFPKNLQGSASEDEGQFYMEISQPVPDPLGDEEDISNRRVFFTSRRGRRGNPEEMELTYPVFSPQAETSLQNRGIRTPPAMDIPLGALAGYEDNYEDTAAKESLIKALRDIYATANHASDYLKMRKECTGN